MNRRAFVISTLTSAAGLTMASGLRAQSKTIKPDLAALGAGGRFRLFSRTASRIADGARTGVRLSEAAGEGVAYLPDIAFADGTIECDLKGKDVPQQSFLGIAFHGVNGTTYDAVYFRPFNFRTQDPVSRRHAVQYHSNPVYGWQKLRTEHPDMYEKAVAPVPDPNAWFHMRMVVASRKVSIFVDGATEPCLSVGTLGDRTTGLVGLWVGNNSGGDFANLAITPS